MTRRQKIIIIGKQRKELDAELMASLIITLGKQLWAEQQAVGEHGQPEQPDGDASGEGGPS